MCLRLSLFCLGGDLGVFLVVNYQRKLLTTEAQRSLWPQPKELLWKPQPNSAGVWTFAKFGKWRNRGREKLASCWERRRLACSEREVKRSGTSAKADVPNSER